MKINTYNYKKLIKNIIPPTSSFESSGMSFTASTALWQNWGAVNVDEIEKFAYWKEKEIDKNKIENIISR